MPKEEWKIFECKDNIPPIVSEELWEKCNNILEKKSKSCIDKVGNKDVFKNRYVFSGLIFCKEHGENIVGFNRISGKKRSGKPAWACSRYIASGLKECESPIIQETELIQVLKFVLGSFLNHKEEIITDLLNKYKQFNSSQDYNSKILKTEGYIREIEIKKDKLLDLTVKELISDEEFYKRNQELNIEIQKYHDQIENLKREKENQSELEENMKQIKIALEKAIKIEENIEDLIKLLVDKIYVSKINHDRKHIKLEIYLKIGEAMIFEGNLRNQDKQVYIIENGKYLLNSNENGEGALIEKDSQSCNNVIYYCAWN